MSEVQEDDTVHLAQVDRLLAVCGSSSGTLSSVERIVTCGACRNIGHLPRDRSGGTRT